MIVERQTKSNEVTPPYSVHGDTNEQFFQGNLTPLERYCCHVQAHEQLAVGQMPNRKSLTGPNQLGNVMDNAAKLLDGLSPGTSRSSWSILSLNQGKSLNMIPAPKLDDLLLATDPAGSQATPPEGQAMHLHAM